MRLTALSLQAALLLVIIEWGFANNLNNCTSDLNTVSEKLAITMWQYQLNSNFHKGKEIDSFFSDDFKYDVKDREGSIWNKADFLHVVRLEADFFWFEKYGDSELLTKLANIYEREEQWTRYDTYNVTKFVDALFWLSLKDGKAVSGKAWSPPPLP